MRLGPPPAVGARLRYGAPPGERGKLYHVRAIVDHEVSEDGEHRFMMVLRTWSRRHGGVWRYVVESFTALEVGLYRPDGEPRELEEEASDDREQ